MFWSDGLREIEVAEIGCPDLLFLICELMEVQGVTWVTVSINGNPNIQHMSVAFGMKGMLV